jgi:general secretion pathway protein I
VRGATTCWSIGSPDASRSARRRLARDATEGGFTLIEILVAFTIATLLLVVLLHSFSNGIVSSTRSETYNEALIIAESTLDSMGTQSPLKVGETTEHAGRFDVRAAVQRAPEAAGEGQYVGPYELTVEVSWHDGARRQSIRLRTLRLGPWQ